MGVKLFMCFPFPWGKGETHKQNSQEISGKGRESPGIVPGWSRDNPVKILFMCFLAHWFSWPYSSRTTTVMRNFLKKSSFPKIRGHKVAATKTRKVSGNCKRNEFVSEGAVFCSGLKLSEIARKGP